MKIVIKKDANNIIYERITYKSSHSKWNISLIFYVVKFFWTALPKTFFFELSFFNEL
jgi:hypothetical protein